MADIVTKRIYAPASPDDGYRVLVDRLRPRGISRQDAAIDEWAKDIAPSTGLRRWFAHDPDRWDEFTVRYRRELGTHTDALRELLDRCVTRRLTLLFAARDLRRNHAAVLKDVLWGTDVPGR